VLAPPGLPPDRVAELRRAFMATVQDPLFMGEIRPSQTRNQPHARRRAPGVVAREGDVPAAFVERARRVAGMTGH